MDAMRKNPLSFFAELRTHRPSCELGGVVFVARYADGGRICHPTVFSVRLYKPKMGDFMLTDYFNPDPSSGQVRDVGHAPAGQTHPA